MRFLIIECPQFAEFDVDNSHEVFGGVWMESLHLLKDLGYDTNPHLCSERFRTHLFVGL